jgi:hypothetical protein
MLAQSWLPLLTASDFKFRLLALEHKTSSFAAGPARAAGPALYRPPGLGTPTAVAGRDRQRGLASLSFFPLSDAVVLSLLFD